MRDNPDRRRVIRRGKEGKKMAKWYAVQETREDAWDYGSHEYGKAVEMLKEQGSGLIAVIDEDSNVCVEEIEYEDAMA